jgi:tetratricopeptide (TPR) repeat protein
MTIRGDLLSVDLSNVFQMLALNRKRGILNVQNRENILEKRALVLDEDRVAVLEIPRPDSLNALLVEMGALSYEAFSEARSKAANFRIGATEYLERRKQISPEALKKAARRLQEEAVLEIFLWHNVTFSLDEEATFDEDPDRTFVIVDHIVMEAARRQDEWKRVVEILGGGADIYEPLAGAAELLARSAAEGVTRIVFDHLDGVFGTPELMAATGLPRYHVDLSIGTLVEGGYVRKIGLEDLLEKGDQLLADDRVGDAIRLFKCAARFDRRSTEIHERLASAYLRAGRVAKAASHEKFCALILAQQGRLDEAVLRFQSIVRMLPTDFRALERTCQLLADRGGILSTEDRGTVEQSMKLFAFCYESRLYEQAERVLGHLMRILKDDENLVLALARLYSKTGRVNDAVEQYMRLAGRLHDRRDLEGALNAYRLAMAFNTASHDICHQRVQQIREKLELRRRRRAVGIAGLVFLVMLAAVGIAYATFARTAQRELDAVASEVQGNKSEHAWREIAGRFRSIARRFPLTAAGRDAARRAADVEQRAEDMLAREERAKQDLADAAEVTLARAKSSFSEALDRQERHEFAGALVSAKRALALAEEVKAAAWITSAGVRELIGAIEGHVAWESGKLRELNDRKTAGRLDQAFTVARELLESDEGDPLNADAIKVLSADTLSKISVPFRIVAYPPARLESGDGSPPLTTPVTIELDLKNPKAALSLAQAGYRPAALELHWRRGEHERHLVLDREPETSWSAERRIAALLAVGGGFLAVGSDGAVTHFGDSEGNVLWRWSPAEMLQVETVAGDELGAAALTTIDGRLIFVTTGARGEVWTKDDVAAGCMAFSGSHVAVATRSAPWRILLLARADGGEAAAYEIPSAPAVIAAQDGALALVGADGRAFVIAAAGSAAARVQEIGGGPFLARIARCAGGFAFARPGGKVAMVDAQGREQHALDAGAGFVTGPCAAGDGLCAILENGALWRVDAQGRATRQTLPLPVETWMAAGRITSASRSDILIERADGGWVRLDAGTGTPRCAYGGTTSATSSPLLFGNRLLLGYAGAHGEVEVYPGD